MEIKFLEYNVFGHDGFEHNVFEDNVFEFKFLDIIMFLLIV